MTKEELKAEAQRGEAFIKGTSNEMWASQIQEIYELAQIDIFDAITTAYNAGAAAGRREAEKRRKA